MADDHVVPRERLGGVDAGGHDRRRGRHRTVPIEDCVESLQAEDMRRELCMSDIDTILGHVKPHQREIVRSISLNGSGIRETADRLQVTEGAVRVTLYRALEALA